MLSLLHRVNGAQTSNLNEKCMRCKDSKVINNLQMKNGKNK